MILLFTHDVFNLDEFPGMFWAPADMLFVDFVWNASFLNIWFLMLNNLLNCFNGIIIRKGFPICCQIEQKRWAWWNLSESCYSWQRWFTIHVMYFIKFLAISFNFPNGSSIDQLWIFFTTSNKHFKKFSFKFCSISVIPHHSIDC